MVNMYVANYASKFSYTVQVINAVDMNLIVLTTK